jgi:hypothetical protein
VIGAVQAKPGREAETEAALRALVAPTHGEPALAEGQASRGSLAPPHPD